MATISNNGHYKKKFLNAFVEIGTISGAAKVAGVNRNTVTMWLKKCPDFAIEFEEAKEAFADTLESVAFKRAVDGSDTLLIFLLKGNRPEKYRDRHEITGKDSGPIEVVDAKEKLLARINAIADRRGTGDSNQADPQS